MLRHMKIFILVILMTALMPLNGFCADGVDGKINANLTRTNNLFNLIIPSNEQSVELRNLISGFLTDYKDYQIQFFKAFEQLPDVIGPDAIGQIDDLLLKGTGKNTFGLKDDLQHLVNTLELRLFPKIITEVVALWENEGLDVAELKVKLKDVDADEKLQIVSDFIRTNLPLGNDHEIDYGSKDNLSARLKQSIKELSSYEKELTQVRDRLLKEEKNFSEKTKTYINAGEDRPDIENKGTVFKRYKKLYLMDEIGQMGLMEKERLTLEAALESIKTNRQGVEVLNRNIDKLSQEEIEYAHHEVDYIKKNYSSYNIYKGPNILLAEGGGCINMYIALIARDVFHAATDGRFVPPSRRRDYQKYKYEDWREKTSHLLKRYATVEGAAAMISFVAVSNVINTQLPTTMVMRSLFGWSDKVLYGAGGKLLRGVSIFGLSMGLGQKVSEVVATGIMWRHELSPSWKGKDVKVIPVVTPWGAPILIPFNKINILAWDMFLSSNFSPQAWEQVAQFIASFGLADIVLDGRIYVGFYNKMKELNKKKCSYTHADIIDIILRKRGLDGKWYSPGYKPWWHAASWTRSTVTFLTADLINDYFLSKFMFPNAEKEQEKLLMAKSGPLAEEEFNEFSDAILQTKPTKEQLANIYDIYGGWVFLKDIIPALRDNYYAVESCLDIRDNKQNLEAKKCLGKLYDKYFQDIGNTIANLKVERDYMQTEEYKKEKHEEALKIYGNKETTHNLIQSSALKKTFTPNVIAKVKMTIEKINGGETRILTYIKDGKLDDADIEIKSYLANLNLSPLYTLLSSVIKEAWQVNKKPSIVLNEKISLSSNKANEYLQRMIYLFTDLYPKTLTAEVKNKEGIEITQNGFRQNILIAIAQGLYKELKNNCDEKDLNMAKNILNDVKIEMTIQSNSKEVISALNTTYPELGLLKEINDSIPPKQ